MVNTRELAVDMLLRMETEGVYSNLLVRDVLDKHDYLEAKEKAFVKRVTEGTVERRIQLDYVLDAYSKVPSGKMKPFIRCLLRMSVYQLLFMDGIPDAAVCNEAVKLAAKRKFGQLKGFVNGVLRSIARNREQIAGIYPDKGKEPLHYLSVMYSMPEFLVSMWLGEYGMERTEGMLRAMLEVHPVTVRVKQGLREREGGIQGGTDALVTRIREAGIGAVPHPYLDYACCLTKLEGVRHVPGFSEGLFTVQDVSSMLAVECAGIREGDFVLDVCAAPGGKATHAAELAGETGKVLCRDISGEKAALVRENAVRLGLDNVEIQVHDARVYDEALQEKADVVLADLPCSGLGILGKKRDIKYNVSLEALQELPKLQRELLSTVWRYVKPQGILLYTTCTIHREENEETVRWFLEHYPFEAEDISGYLEGVPEKETAKEGYIQLLPGVHAADGFFIAKFRRKDWEIEKQKEGH